MGTGDWRFFQVREAFYRTNIFINFKGVSRLMKDNQSRWKKIKTHFLAHKMKYISLSVLGMVMFYAAIVLILTWPIDVYSVEKAGVFGDSFGVITCFFTACGFIGLLINLDEQRKYSAQQQVNVRKQDFESKFFYMMNNLNEIVMDVEYTIKERGVVTSFKGRSAIEELLGVLQQYYRRSSQDGFFDIVTPEIEKFDDCYEKYWNQWGRFLSHYYTWIYSILKFIDDDESIDKSFYANLLKAKLSKQEAIIIFYTASTRRGKDLRILVTKYNFFDTLEVNDLFFEEHAAFINGVTLIQSFGDL
ncbi:hypothetical protein IAE30_07210 [Pantoea sp. S61]|uniref:putative phage abortive infection protein n=1 Tax=Pantoea sp. S61 TaxID=2767442 RepID=UPI001909BD6D|nr:putative phage abortive infection protein [Pantoea sp. S61]MBK0123530.1 hypothetical protein [Pantoea sp. S61]